MPIPKYFVLERAKALKEREKLLAQILSRLGAQDKDVVCRSSFLNFILIEIPKLYYASGVFDFQLLLLATWIERNLQSETGSAVMLTTHLYIL
jgi:hypothetical protein